MKSVRPDVELKHLCSVSISTRQALYAVVVRVVRERTAFVCVFCASCAMVVHP